MQLRPPVRLLASAGALALATVLTSCGFDYATDRNYTPGASVNDRDAMVDVLGAAVVSAQDGSGTFVASFANNDQLEEATVESIEGEGLDFEDFEPIEIPAGGFVNLADEGGVEVTAEEIAAGDFVTVTIGLGDGESVELKVPVMPNCNEWEGIDTSGSGATTEDQCTVEAPELEH